MAKRLATSSLTFRWNFEKSIIIERKGFGQPLNKYIANTFMSHMRKYVPWDTKRKSGIHLADSAYVRANKDKGYVIYPKPYTKVQYTGDGIDEGNRDRAYHPLATSYWDEFCWENEGRDMINEINAYRRRISK